jgi:hypothetical protein
MIDWIKTAQGAAAIFGIMVACGTLAWPAPCSRPAGLPIDG